MASVRKLRHGGILNALASAGLEAERDPNDPDTFQVTANEIIGRWSKNSEGAVKVAITEENDQVKGHGSVRAFLNELTKKQRRDARKNMH